MKKKLEDDVSDTEIEEEKEEKEEDSIDEKDDEESDDDKLSDGMDLDDDEDDNRCFYKFVDNDEEGDGNEEEDEEYDDDNLTEMIEEPVIKTQYVDADKRITHPHMTKYEYVRVLGDRMMQLSNGAKPMIKNFGDMSIKEIAHNEIMNGVVPFKIERPLPNGDIEVWGVGELTKSII